MTEIQGVLEELQGISQELTAVNKHAKELREKKKELNHQVSLWLKENDREGVKYKGHVFLAETKSRRPAKKAKEKKKDVTELFTSYGISDAGELYEKVMEAMKGEEKKVTTVVSKKYDPFA